MTGEQFDAFTQAVARRTSQRGVLALVRSGAP
jgi:hypothetical protein